MGEQLMNYPFEIKKVKSGEEVHYDGNDILINCLTF
jgi:hypothetical protein